MDSVRRAAVADSGSSSGVSMAREYDDARMMSRMNCSNTLLETMPSHARRRMLRGPKRQSECSCGQGISSRRSEWGAAGAGGSSGAGFSSPSSSSSSSPKAESTMPMKMFITRKLPTHMHGMK